jgi:hypothetical protein
VTGQLSMEIVDTSSPATPLATVTRPHVISTITRDYVITSGGQG